LRRVSPQSPGWSRIRRGRGFSYVDQLGTPLDPGDADRCRALTIPPAWREVWICPYPNGHLQAVGLDDAGRRQYLYHPEWRRLRDEAKFDHVLEVAARLPRARTLVVRAIGQEGMPRERALATAFRLLDQGLFRIGGEEYAEENGSEGLVTLQRQRVRVERSRALFSYPAKGGQDRFLALADPELLGAVTLLRRRRGGSDRLLAYRDARRWCDVTSTDVNDYIKQLLGDTASAKDFRTWHGTVCAAVSLARLSAPSRTARKRAIPTVMREVAELLGNTPAVARSAYVDPRVIDLFEDGVTIEASLGGFRAARPELERAVLSLLA
jgi:DNA topoisomerase IB